MLRNHSVATGVAVIAVAAGAAGCHVTIQSETVRPSMTERVADLGAAIARRPTIVLTAAGRLRFVEPLDCPTDEITRQRTTIEIATRPNLATFTVGVIAATIGSVMGISGVLSSRPGASPSTYAGIAGLAIGAPLAIGPWVGNRTQLRTVPDSSDPGDHRHPGPRQPCGDRPLAAGTATLAVGGLEVYGAIDRDGVFSVSPYQWTDAYGAGAIGASAVTAIIEAGGARRTIEAVIDAEALASHAADFLAHADFDANIEALKRVPGIAVGALQVSLSTTATGAAVRVVLPLRNDGPGEAWALRGQIIAPQVPAIDGRMIYVGALANGAAVARVLVIPLASRAVAALRSQTIELSVELRDAHGTAPATPVRFRGTLSGDGSQ